MVQLCALWRVEWVGMAIIAMVLLFCSCGTTPRRVVASEKLDAFPEAGFLDVSQETFGHIDFPTKLATKVQGRLSGVFYETVLFRGRRSNARDAVHKYLTELKRRTPEVFNGFLKAYDRLVGPVFKASYQNRSLFERGSSKRIRDYFEKVTWQVSPKPGSIDDVIAFPLEHLIYAKGARQFFFRVAQTCLKVNRFQEAARSFELLMLVESDAKNMRQLRKGWA